MPNNDYKKHYLTLRPNALIESSGNPFLRVRVSTVDLLVVTSSDQLLFRPKLHFFYKTDNFPLMPLIQVPFSQMTFFQMPLS
jgi:hypothetical protein